jgi:hypothetical protein
MGSRHVVAPGREYIIGDAIDELEALDESPQVIYFDDAWARPYRANQFGVEYPTHPFSSDSNTDSDDVYPTTTDILDACYDVLAEGGWLIADADDWLLPRLLEYLREEWGDVTENYRGGGYRRVGGVVHITKDNEPDGSTPGQYLSNGGYPVVFAHKGPTDRRSSVPARQLAPNPRNKYDWGSIKPIAPYRAWMEALLDPDELLVVPCAGTAPAAIAAEQAFGDETRYICIDIKDGAFEAFSQRRTDVFTEDRQTLSES